MCIIDEGINIEYPYYCMLTSCKGSESTKLTSSSVRGIGQLAEPNSSFRNYIQFIAKETTPTFSPWDPQICRMDMGLHESWNDMQSTTSYLLSTGYTGRSRRIERPISAHYSGKTKWQNHTTYATKQATWGRVLRYLLAFHRIPQDCLRRTLKPHS